MSDRERSRGRSRERRYSSRRRIYTPSPEDGLRREMREMLSRLRALEERSLASPARRSRSRERRGSRARSRRSEHSGTPPLPLPSSASRAGVTHRPPPSGASYMGAEPPLSSASGVVAVRPPQDPTAAGASEASAPSTQQATSTDRIVEAIRSINTVAQSTGKLDSGMRGPYRVLRVLQHGRYELQLLAGSYGKTTQAAAEYMIPWRGEWTPEVCAAYFEGGDSEDEGSTSAVAELSSGTQPPSAAAEPLPVEAGPSSLPGSPLMTPADVTLPAEEALLSPVTAPVTASSTAASMPLLDTETTT